MASTRSKIAKPCLQCHKEFFPHTHSPGKYCSAACRHKGIVTKREVSCATCGTLVIRHPCELDGEPACSKECLKEFLSKTRLADKNPNWGGEKVGLSALHGWVQRRLIKPKKCQDCDEERGLDLANISQEYRRDITDWEWLCRKCHMTKDGRLEKLKQRMRERGHPAIEKKCEYCHKIFKTSRYVQRFCSLSCVTTHTDLFIRDYSTKAKDK